MIMSALEGDRVHLVRQPIVSVGERKPVIYEVLARLEDEDGTIRKPVEFIPQAEALGLVERIDRRVVAGACERWSRYADADMQLMLSVNMSARSFGAEMLQFLDEQARKWGVDQQALTVEITETAVTRGGVQTEAFVHRLRDQGLRVAMDDFGSGSTSFRLMRDLRLDYVKLDGSLIRDLATDATGRDFVRAIADVAHATGAHVIAEHVQDYAEGLCSGIQDPARPYAAYCALGMPSWESDDKKVYRIHCVSKKGTIWRIERIPEDK